MLLAPLRFRPRRSTRAYRCGKRAPPRVENDVLAVRGPHLVEDVHVLGRERCEDAPSQIQSPEESADPDR